MLSREEAIEIVDVYLKQHEFNSLFNQALKVLTAETVLESNARNCGKYADCCYCPLYLGDCVRGTIEDIVNGNDEVSALLYALEPYEEPKIKISQNEMDALRCLSETNEFNDSGTVMIHNYLRNECGWFEDSKDGESIRHYLNRVEVQEDEGHQR